jgi:hypothetical protein
MIFDSHGEIAARICSVLSMNGHLESDAVAESAMVPAKDTREVRNSYDLQQWWNLEFGSLSILACRFCTVSTERTI